MSDPSMQKLFEKFSDLSLLEKLKQSDTSHLFLNLGLYLITVMPLMATINLSILAKPWESLPTIVLLLFLIAGFGGLYKLAEFIRHILQNLRLYVELKFLSIIARLGRSELIREPEFKRNYKDDLNIVYLPLIERYLATQDEPRTQKIYEQQKQAINDWFVARENAMFTLLLLLAQLLVNGILIQNIAQSFPLLISFLWLVCIGLAYWSTCSLPESKFYLYLPNNKN
ncbi:MAG: hypothetical protein MUD14_29635 [Hydrococcus sp. Prado102]|jgi:hypothetical protein|nr:hypothetical protein [Hydrococcus sp. Prado102]